MNLNSHNSPDMYDSGIDGASTGEDTLRLIAGLPAPKGLEERVRRALRTAPRQGRVLAWPQVLRAEAAWVRATAAAAIVMVVAGGGWGVYSHIQPWHAGNAPAARVGAMGGFSGANAVRSPQTLEPPVVSPPAKSAVQSPMHKKALKKKAKVQPEQPAAQP
jgi:hypothetical protein